MPVYISLLRGINILGRKTVPMAELRDVCRRLGLSGVDTHLQSGNVIFHSRGRSAARLGRDIQAAVADRFGLDIAVQIRTLDAWRAVAAGNPFLVRPRYDRIPHHVTFFNPAPDMKMLAEPPRPPAGEEDFRFAPGTAPAHVYIYCPAGYGRTKLTNDFFERWLGVSATTRNWNTVEKVLEKAEALAKSVNKAKG